MPVKRKRTSLVAAVMGALLIAPIQPPVASAASISKTSNTLSVITGTIRIFATTTQTFTSTGAQLSTSISNNVAKTFYVNNGGSRTVSRFVMTITLPTSSNVSSFRRCNINVAFTGTNICASGSSTLLTNPVSGSATNYLISLPGPGFYSFQITQNKTGTMTVDTTSNTSFITGVVNNS